MAYYGGNIIAKLGVQRIVDEEFSFFPVLGICSLTYITILEVNYPDLWEYC